MSLFSRWVRSYAVPTEGLALFRILFAAQALVLELPAFGWAGTLPPAFYNPSRYSLGALLEVPPSALVLNVFSLAAVVLFVALLFGYRTRAVSLLLAVVLVVGLTFVYGYGKIKHQYVFFAAVPLVMAFSPWGQAFSLDAARRGARPAPLRWSNAWPVALMALVIGFGYFSAGLPKAPVWFDLDLSTHGARSWLVNGFQSGRQGWLAEWFFHNENPYLWEGMDYLAVSFELGFLLAVLHVTAFRAFLIAAIGFHAANVFIMNIDFTHLAFIYALFLPWDRILAGAWGGRLAGLARPFASRRLFAASTVLFGGLAALALAFDPEYLGVLPNVATLTSSDSYLKKVQLLINLLVGGVIAAVLARHLTAGLFGAVRRSGGRAGVAAAP